MTPLLDAALAALHYKDLRIIRAKTECNRRTDTMPTNPSSKRIIVALDVSTSREAIELTHSLRDHVELFKVGIQLFTAAGPRVVQEILKANCRVFLDLKFHDIPNTVAGACVEASRMGVSMMTLHTLGGESMMKQARETVQEKSEQEGWPIPSLLGVTVLTSMDQRTLASIGVGWPMEEQVVNLASSAQGAGLDGVVCSPRELGLLSKEQFQEMVFVTPGIRSTHSLRDDQSRTMTASEALAGGANYLVVGRPIIRADHPVRAVQELLKEIEGT